MCLGQDNFTYIVGKWTFLIRSKDKKKKHNGAKSLNRTSDLYPMLYNSPESITIPWLGYVEQTNYCLPGKVKTMIKFSRIPFPSYFSRFSQVLGKQSSSIYDRLTNSLLTVPSLCFLHVFPAFPLNIGIKTPSKMWVPFVHAFTRDKIILSFQKKGCNTYAVFK